MRLYSLFNPPPYRRPNMEFDFGLWYGICTFRSENGRQIGENNTDPEIYREEVKTDHQISTFEGTRKGLPINVTALREVMALWDDAMQRTTLLISHRFPTVRMADRILVLEDGRIIEQGTHAELLAAGARYARLFELQAQGYL